MRTRSLSALMLTQRSIKWHYYDGRLALLLTFQYYRVLREGTDGPVAEGKRAQSNVLATNRVQPTLGQPGGDPCPPPGRGQQARQGGRVVRAARGLARLGQLG